MHYQSALLVNFCLVERYTAEGEGSYSPIGFCIGQLCNESRERDIFAQSSASLSIPHSDIAYWENLRLYDSHQPTCRPINVVCCSVIRADGTAGECPEAPHAEPAQTKHTHRRAQRVQNQSENLQRTSSRYTPPGCCIMLWACKLCSSPSGLTAGPSGEQQSMPTGEDTPPPSAASTVGLMAVGGESPCARHWRLGPHIRRFLVPLQN